MCPLAMARVTGAERVQVGYVIVRFHVIVSYGKFLMAVTPVGDKAIPHLSAPAPSLRYPQHEFVAVAPGLRSDGPGEGVVGGVEGAVTEVSATTLAHR